MFRRQLLPSACFTIVLAAVALTAAAPSRGQDLTTDERIDRLERDLNMLQRQVYQGAPPPAAGAANAGSAVDLEVRMERLEQQMRDLTGRVEELGNQVGQLHQRIEQVNSDVDMRLGQAPGPTSAAVPGPAPAPPARPDLAAPPPAGLPYPPAPPDGAMTPPVGNPPSGGPVPIFGTLNPPGAGPPRQPSPRTAAAMPPTPRSVPPHTPAEPTPATALPAGPTTEQFDYAFKLVRKADYPAAEVALRAFVVQHPKDHLAGSAQYWLGETYFARGRYLEAASAFAEGYKRWPKGPKAADDLLKLGISLSRANEKPNACLALDQLNHDFPHPGTAIRERAIAERHRLGC
jgi:tol-pal system protein YbgF